MIMRCRCSPHSNNIGKLDTRNSKMFNFVFWVIISFICPMRLLLLAAFTF